MGPFGPGRIRAVLHLDVDDAGVDQALQSFASVLSGP
jgi:hypothetical protein